MNKVTIEGNITHDPEVRTTPSGSTLVTFDICHNDWNPKTRESKPHYFSVTAFGTAVDRVSKWGKGTPVIVEGKLQFRSWDTPEGKRSKVSIAAFEVHKIERERRDAEPAKPAAKKGYSDPGEREYEEDPPF